MSTCPQCYTGTCKRHKLQDHGRSMVKSANAESTLKKMYDQLVGSKLQKLRADADKDSSGQRTKEFRKKLDASRDKSLRKSHKSRSKVAKDVTGSGLNPQALAAIYDSDSDSDSEEERRKRKKEKKHKHKHSSSKKRKHRSRSGSDSSSSDSDDSSRHKRKHHKKSHKKRHKSSRIDNE
ncbi:hypothetical protein V7S43_009769 [Phytophthora oleae]|uniref:Uncharacterized protein n=1 Tax=Phytophthora oleae TaxID=2107226 RepID=A0ABD3FGX4_9STRA